MLTFLKKYNQQLQHQHGWEVELDCPVCGNRGLPDYTGWTPDSNIRFGARPTIFANVSCPRCGQDLKQQAGEKLIELFSHVPTPARNRRLIVLLISLLVGLPLLLCAVIWAGVQLADRRCATPLRVRPAGIRLHGTAGTQLLLPLLDVGKTAVAPGLTPGGSSA